MTTALITQQMAAILANHGMGPSPHCDLSNPKAIKDLFRNMTLFVETSTSSQEMLDVIHLLAGPGMLLKKALKNEANKIAKLAFERLQEQKLTDELKALFDSRKAENNELKAIYKDLENSFLDQMSPLQIVKSALAVFPFTQEPQSKEIELGLAILKEIKDSLFEAKDPNFSFVERTPSNITILFKIVRFLCLEGFQEKYLEPFQERFPEISLDQMPDTVMSLKLEGDIREIDFTKFIDLAHLDLSAVTLMTVGQLTQIFAIKSIKSFKLPKNLDISNLRLPEFLNLEEINLHELRNVYRFHVNQICKSKRLKSLILTSQERKFDLTDFDFSSIPNVELLNLSGVISLSQNQLNQISQLKKLKDLTLPDDFDVSNLTFPKFQSLEFLRYKQLGGMTQDHVIQISESKNLKNLSLTLRFFHIEDFDFTSLPNVETLDISGVFGLTQTQINQLSELQNLKVLRLPNLLNARNITFPPFQSLEIIYFSHENPEFLGFTSTHLTQISHSPNLKELKVPKGADLTGVDFSLFSNLKILDLSLALNLSSDQIRQISRLPQLRGVLYPSKLNR